MISEHISKVKPDYVICTGSFGFFDEESVKTVQDRHLPRIQPKANGMIEGGAVRRKEEFYKESESKI